MSTDYRPLGQLFISDLLDGRLEVYGIKEHSNAEESCCLFDSASYVHVHETDGKVESFSRYAGNNADYILSSVSEAYGLRIVSEYEPEYWGFDTQAEWDAAWAAMAKKDEEKHYLNLIRYVRGEPTDIIPGTVGHLQAEIAKELVSAEPNLSDADMRDALLARVKEGYHD